MEKLTSQEVEGELAKLDNWKLKNEKWIEKSYRFQAYLAGIEFVQQIAKLSEDTNHHPFISVDYKLITVKLSSWRANGLTELDFSLAKKFDDMYEKTRK